MLTVRRGFQNRNQSEGCHRIIESTIRHYYTLRLHKPRSQTTLSREEPRITIWLFIKLSLFQPLKLKQGLPSLWGQRYYFWSESAFCMCIRALGSGTQSPHGSSHFSLTRGKNSGTHVVPLFHTCWISHTNCMFSLLS